MSIFIAGDSPQTCSQVQAALTQLGCAINPRFIAPIDCSLRIMLSSGSLIRMVVVILPPGGDQAFRFIREVREQTHLPVAVIGPVTDPHSILSSLDSGADHYIDLNGNLLAPLEKYLNRHRSPSSSFTVSGKLIAVVSPCGGTGVSILAANLAVTVAQRQRRCTLLDLNVGRGDQAALFNLSPRHHLNDLVDNLDSLDRNILEQSLTTHASGTRLLAANEDLLDNDHAYQIGLRKICQLSRQTSECTFLDYPLNYHEERMGVLRECDRVLIVIRPDFTSLKNLCYLVPYLDRLALDPSRVDVVANRVGTPQEIPAAQLKYGNGKTVDLTVEDMPELVNRSVNCGTPVVLAAPQSKFSRSIQKLAQVVFPVEASASDINGKRQLSAGLFRLPFSKNSKPPAEMQTAASSK